MIGLVVIILAVAAICGAIGYFTSSDDRKESTAIKNAVNGGFGCAYIIIMLLIGWFIVFVVFD